MGGEKNSSKVPKKTQSKPKPSPKSIIPELGERVPTGIPKFDEIIEGGFIEGSSNLVTGTSGTGKTFFAAQFIYNGLKSGESCLYISVEQETDTILMGCKALGLDFEPYIRENKCLFIDAIPLTFTELEKLITSKIASMNVKRIAIDSVSVLLMTTKDLPKISEAEIIFEKIVPSQLRRNLFKLTKTLRSKGVTTLMVSEIPTTNKGALSRLGFEEYMSDSITKLSMFEYAGGETPRSLQVIKMRGSKHNQDMHPFKINHGGITIFKPKKGIVI